jgi:hypothetical protein
VPPPLQIKVDQSGKPPGVPGQAREDLALGTAVQLAAVGGPFDAYLWTLAFKPVDVVAGARSSAALSSATTSTTLVQPIDKAGTYRVGIAVDAGFGLGAREQDVAFITFYAGPTLSADPTQYPRREPAVGETTEHNAPDAIDPGGNVDGWARERARWDAADAQRSLPPAFSCGALISNTTALVQRMRAGETNVTDFVGTPTDGTHLGHLCTNRGRIRRLAIRFTGDAGNVAGQTVAAQIYKNGSLSATGTAVASNVASPTTQLDVLGAVVDYAPGDFLQLAIVLSAALTNALANINVTAGE